jgi:hypothetical protein
MNKIALAIAVSLLFGCTKKEEPAQQTVLFATPSGIVDQHGRPVIIQNAGGQWAGQQAPTVVGQEQQYQPLPQVQYPTQAPIHSTVPQDNSGLTTGEVVGAAALAAAAASAGYLAGKNRSVDNYRNDATPPSTYQSRPADVRQAPQAPAAKPTAVPTPDLQPAAKPKIENSMVQSGPAMNSLPSMKSQVPVTQASAPTAYAQQQGVPNKPMQAAPTPAPKPAPAPTPATTFKSAPVTLPQAPTQSRWSTAPATSTSSRSVGLSTSSSGSKR